jgi:AcrR family transcriptional regulator
MAKRAASNRDEAAGADSPRRQTLLEIAANLFANQGYQATTVRDIASAAGILSGSIYHHFASKQEMLEELLTRCFDETIREYQAVASADLPPAEALTELIKATLRISLVHRAPVLVWNNERQYLESSGLGRAAFISKWEHEAEQLWSSVLVRGIEAGEFNPAIVPRFVYYLMRDAIWAAIGWFREGGSASFEQITDLYCTILLNGVIATSASD